MGATTPTIYSKGDHAYLYKESIPTLRSQVNAIIALCSVFLVLCWTTVGLRIYVRAGMMKAMGADDIWMMATMAAFTVYAVLLIVICANLIPHIPAYAAGEVPVSLAVPRMIVAGYCLYSVVSILFKFSLGYFFLRVFSTRRLWRTALIWISMVLPALLGILNIAWTARLPCQLESVFFAGLPSCGEFKSRTDWAVVAALWAGVSVITDIIYGVLAFLSITKLQMTFKVKVTAALLCSLGCIGGVAACVRMYFLIAQVPHLSVLGEALHTAIWSVIEPGLAIVAASMAMLKPLWNRLRDPNWSLSGQGTRPTPAPTTAPATRLQSVFRGRPAEKADDKSSTTGILVCVDLEQI
ncbi:hypothetical protein K461DRAFT_294480 [Myriangium duriaei CBS 260.36]|uniref:Rhodopsin domain-containing protein n=1 Tax=Myriangium duriaei CBS 260.36 TaxID=1168546 RepID=A0A9P4IXR0_9PEZI|nr:hypothetical protein K461DRAFT_294480 [Myriangium duriaei CBS 260.36]